MKLTDNRLIISTGDTGSLTTEYIAITSISVLATGATWTLKLDDTAGFPVLHIDNNTAAPMMMSKPIKAVGLKVNTLTNITTAILGVDILLK